MGNTPPRYGILVGLTAAVGAFGAAAVMSASTAPTAHADDTADVLSAVQAILADGQGHFTTAATDFSGGDLTPGLAAFFDGANDDLLGAPDNVLVGAVAELTNEPFTPIVDFPVPIPDSFTSGFTNAQEFFLGGQTSFTDAATALSGGDYGLAAYYELVGLNVTSIVPLEELLLGASAAFSP